MKFKNLLLAAAAALACGTAAAAPAWITLSDDALQVLQRMVPQVEVLGTRQVPVTVPEARGSARLEARHETVHAVEIDDNWLEILSVMVHGELQRCGGYKHHASMAEALATLHRLSQPEAQSTAVNPRPSYAIDNVTQVEAMLPQVQASHILSTIQTLSDFQNRRYNSSHGVAASNWLYDHWKSLAPAGRRNIRVTQISHPTWPQKSVSFEIIGGGNPGEIVVLGAHLDSIAGSGIETSRAPGADDNASGIAGLTEIIRVLMANNFSPKRTMRFFAYAAEEVGLRGSQAIAADFATRRSRVVGVLNLDMTAYQGNPQDIWIYTDYTDALQNQFIVDLVGAYLPHLTVAYSACGYACSDHAAWHARGFFASFPHEAANNAYNPWIHTSTDTTARFGNQANHALKFTQLGLAYAIELGLDDPVVAPGATADASDAKAETQAGGPARAR
jgi:bacterial leucyl aminopeptidase